MSTNSDQPQANEPAPEETFDELTGVYGFFRKYQKLLLYTAGLFTLLTFSITGSLQSLVGGVFNKDVERGSIEVSGVRAQLTGEDYDYGSMIARSFGRLPAGVLLPIQAGDGGDSELAEILAILRRAAILEGFEPSMAEVDKAIEFSREQFQLESAAKLATRSGFSSTQELRVIVAEAMRIGMYQRLQGLASDTSDAEVMRKVLRNQKKSAYKVAVWDAEAKQEAMIEASELSDEELKKWLDEQNEAQQRRMGVFGLPRVKLRIAAVLFGEGQFDAEQWKDGVLKDLEASPDQLRAYYDGDPDRWTDEDGNLREFDDEAVQQELQRMVQAEQVMQDLNTKLRARIDEVVKPMTDKVAEAQADFDGANEARSKTLQDKLSKEKIKVKAEEALAAKPDDAELKAAAETAKAEAEAAATADFEEEQRLQQMEAGLEAAKEAEQQARVGFDLAAEFAELTKDKAGFVTKETAELYDSEQLADLDELGLDLGKWATANSATAIRTPGQLGFGPAQTSKGVILYQALEADPTPLKPWEELKPLIQEAFFSKKATDEVIEKNKQMKETILRLAKEQMPDFVKEKTDGRQARIDETMAEWEKGINEEIAQAEQKLKIPGLGGRAKKIWQQSLKTKQGELAGKEARVKSTEMTVDRDIENEIKAEALKHYGAVIEAAAKEHGYDLVELGPLPQKLSSRPRYADNYDKVTQYVYRIHNEMEAGEANGPTYQNRMSTVIVCTDVLPLEAADVTRREFELLRNNFAARQLGAMLGASFTQEALAERYKLEKPVGEQDAPQQP